MKGSFKKQGFKIGTLIVLVFLLIYLPSLLFIMYNNGIDTDILRIGRIEDVVNVDGVFVRNEQVIISPDSGNCIMDASEGEKVPAFSKIATVVKNVPISTYEELKKKELEIEKAETARAKNINVFSSDIQKLDNEIISEVKLLSKQTDRGSLVNSYSTINTIDSISYRKSDIFGSSSKSQEYITQLKNEKAKLQSQLNSNISEIVTKYSGLVSYAVDGYESLLTPDFIRNATVADLEKIEARNTNRDYQITQAKKGQPIAKIIKDLENYIVCTVDEKLANQLMVDDGVTLRINDNGANIKASVFFSSNVMEGKRVVAFIYDAGLNETVGLRKANIDLVKSSYEGIKVPYSSLKNIDMENKTAEIVLVKNTSAVTRKVSIIGANSEAVIIDSIPGENTIALYNTYVLNPKNIQEGQRIN